MVIDFKKMITSIEKKDMTDTMKGRLMDNCPLSYSSKIYHPSYNWWNGTKCTYPSSLFGRDRQRRSR